MVKAVRGFIRHSAIRMKGRRMDCRKKIQRFIQDFSQNRKVYLKNFVINSLLVIFSIYITIIALSVYIRNFQWGLMTERERMAKKQGIEFDNRDLFTVYEWHKSRNENVGVTTIAETGMQSDVWPLSGGLSGQKKLIYCNEGGYYCYRSTDRFGFYNDDS